jgi:23S rRNA (guanosine2251-2'-O)-methyltransferase
MRLRDLGIWIVALDAAGTDLLWDHTLLAEPLAVVAGGEGAGVGRLSRERSDARLRIPLRGHVESLNVATAAAVALFEVGRVRMVRKGAISPKGQVD